MLIYVLKSPTKIRNIEGIKKYITNKNKH